MAWLEKRNGKYKVAYRDGGGKIKRIPAYTDKLASKQMMADLERALARGEQGLVDPYKQHKARPLAEHVKDYVDDLRALGRDGMYVYTCEKRLAKLVGLCGWKVLGDITAESFCRWRAAPIRQKMAESQDKAVGPRTLNQYLEVLRGFCRWCVRRKRLASNPVAEVEKVDETADVRRGRRALTPEQLADLLGKVPGHYQHVYRFILTTGLRRQEVADLRWGDLRLDLPTPFLKLRAKATKSRRADSLPLRADLAAELRTLRDGAGEGDRVFAAVPTVGEHRAYLAAAGIEWKDDEGRRLDVHALRHTYGTLLSRSGVSPARGDGTDAAHRPASDDEDLYRPADLRPGRGGRKTSDPAAEPQYRRRRHGDRRGGRFTRSC